MWSHIKSNRRKQSYFLPLWNGILLCWVLKHQRISSQNMNFEYTQKETIPIQRKSWTIFSPLQRLITVLYEIKKNIISTISYFQERSINHTYHKGKKTTKYFEDFHTYTLCVCWSNRGRKIPLIFNKLIRIFLYSLFL